MFHENLEIWMDYSLRGRVREKLYAEEGKHYKREEAPNWTTATNDPENYETSSLNYFKQFDA